MKLNLRAARKLDSKITSKLNEGVEYTRTYNAFEDYNMQSEMVGSAITVAEDVERQVQLLTVRANIRRAIQVANEECGINDLIAQRKLAMDELALYKNIVSLSKVEFTSDQINRKLKAIRDAGVQATTYGNRSNDEVTIPLINNDLREQAETKVIQLERFIEQLDDQILALNTGTKISISDVNVDLLQEVNLIA